VRRILLAAALAAAGRALAAPTLDEWKQERTAAGQPAQLQ